MYGAYQHQTNVGGVLIQALVAYGLIQHQTNVCGRPVDSGECKSNVDQYNKHLYRGLVSALACFSSTGARHTDMRATAIERRVHNMHLYRGLVSALACFNSAGARHTDVRATAMHRARHLIIVSLLIIVHTYIFY